MAWNRPKSGEAESLPLQRKGGSSSFLKRKGFRFSVRGAIAGAIVVIGAGIVAWWILGSDDNHAQGTEHKAQGTIREVTPAGRGRQALLDEARKLPSGKRARRKIELIPGQPEVEVPEVVQLPKLTPEQWASIKRPWNSTTEQLLVQMLACPPGLPAKPLSVLPQEELEHIMDILAFPSKEEEGDDEGDLWAKNLINEGKKLMVQYIADGGEPYDFLRHYHEELEKAQEMRDMVTLEVQRLITEEKDIDLAKEFQKSVNEKLVKEGIVPVDIDFEFEEEEMNSK